MRFKHSRKGFISQGFAQNANGAYKKQGLIGHTGVDWVHGYGTPVQTDNKGFVYKVYTEGDRKDNWQAVYQLVKLTKHTYMEVTIGHLSEIYVKEGQTLPEDYFVGAEGNKGMVFSQGVRITPTMQRNGDRRGSHVHESYRPCERVKKISRKEYYLLKDGKKYKDKAGYFYQIINRDNGVRGCVDPRRFDYVTSAREKLSNFTIVLKYIKSLIK